MYGTKRHLIEEIQQCASSFFQNKLALTMHEEICCITNKVKRKYGYE